MKKIAYLLSLGLLLLTACKGDEGASSNFGEVTYHPAFLWSDADTTLSTQTFVLDFNADAKADQQCFAEFQFVENDGKTPISDQVMEIYIDGKKQVGNAFRVDPSMQEVTMSFGFTEQAESGKHQGKLLLTRHKLDRIEGSQSVVLEEGDQAEVLQWTLHFDKQWNPLKTGLSWLVGILLAILALWFLVLKWLLYPRIGLKNLQLTTKTTQSNYKIKDFIGVELNARPKRQSALRRICCGEILYITDPCWTSPIEIIPGNRPKSIKLTRMRGYAMNPPKTTLKAFESAELTNLTDRSKIKLMVS